MLWRLREITPKRETESSILKSLDLYVMLICISLKSQCFLETYSLNFPVEGKVKHRSQCFIYRHCYQIAESQPARYPKVDCGAYERCAVPLEALG